jgi:hypothetical protein
VNPDQIYLLKTISEANKLIEVSKNPALIRALTQVKGLAEYGIQMQEALTYWKLTAEGTPPFDLTRIAIAKAMRVDNAS